MTQMQNKKAKFETCKSNRAEVMKYAIFSVAVLV